jgi:2,3-dihydroxyphenylpropionate 1,2-dioxygenase
MGEIVAAIGTAHSPYSFTRPPDEKADEIDLSIECMKELGRILDETKPDVIIFIGNDHIETFSASCMPTFAVIAGNYAHAEWAGREYKLPVHREMAEDMLEKLIDQGFDLAYSEDATLGHSFAVPFEYVIGGRKIPVIPVFANVYLPPLPNPKRCAALGKAIADFVKQRKERVAVIASGGMSHYPGTVKYHHPEYDFDRWIVTQFEAGNANALLDMTVQQLDEAGNTELLAWAVLFGAIGPQPGELIQYIPTWHHGLCYMRFLPARPHKTSVFEAAQKDKGGLQFKNQGYAFYKHPPAHAYNLNRLLFEIRNDAALRERCVDDLDSVADEYQLGPEQRKAAQTFIDVGEGKKLVSDYCEPLVNAGAHPLTVLLSLHAINSTVHKKRQAAQQTKAPVQS